MIGLKKMTTAQKNKIGKPYIAFFSDNCLLIDLDDISYDKVVKVAKRLLYKHKLEGYCITESSPKHYHIIFNKPIDWKLIMQILFRFRKMSVEAWAKQQAMKGFCALRVNSAKHDFKPHIVTEYGETDKAISEYKAILQQFGDC